MKTFAATLTFSFVAVFTVTQDACSQSPVKLIVKLHPQEKSNWCWAACGQMIMGYFGKNIPQRKQVMDRFGVIVNQTSLPDFGKYGFKFRKSNGKALTWKDVKTEIDNRRPFCFTQRHVGGGAGHMLVVTGYLMDGNDRFLYVFDPHPVGVGDDNGFLSFEEYEDGQLSGFVHGDAYFDFAKQGN